MSKAYFWFHLIAASLFCASPLISIHFWLGMFAWLLMIAVVELAHGLFDETFAIWSVEIPATLTRNEGEVG